MTTKTNPTGRIMSRDEAAHALTMWWTDTLWLPFIETDDCDITGPGHQDRAAFAALVTAYDRDNAGDPNLYAHRAEQVGYRWVFMTEDEHGQWMYVRAAPTDEGAVPVTTLWGAR
ncbi:hypothetical protein BRM3_09025 [Brachybacterium huguangmaarense]|uniref:SnoaL-like domain-containing protein n=1 Tax=Brachybacterium huguangmaarense TaxID=1652028 RepID=A0ABY6FXY1_9MICO|nr:hypothetical protein [Brachybacterium huguangmaarense]UYG15787.1 hypothetical protein BRM3_09025 [Brachybacterium huguangmaarense]